MMRYEGIDDVRRRSDVRSAKGLDWGALRDECCGGKGDVDVDGGRAARERNSQPGSEQARRGEGER